MKKDSTFGFLVLITVLISIIQFLNYAVQLGTTLFKIQENPLIPKYLWKFAAFPLVILSVLNLILATVAYLNFKQHTKNYVLIIILFISTIVLTLFGSDVYQFINTFNPYA